MTFPLAGQVSPMAGSPRSPASGSESPGLTGRMTRTESRRQFKSKIDELIEAIKLTNFYSTRIASLGRNEKFKVEFTDQTGARRTYQIGRAEYREFVSQIISEMKKLPKFAGELYKTHRRAAPMAGFNAPKRFVADIVNFFTNANLGPIISGQFEIKTTPTKEKRVPKNSTLQNHGGRLNDALFFIRRTIGTGNNPLYGIVAHGTLTSLYALHAYYDKMAIADQAGRLSASDSMRSALAQVMAKAIDTDAANFTAKYPSMATQIAGLANQLKQAIRDRSIMVNSMVVDKEMFNPNYFKYAHFSKLNKASHATGADALTEEGLQGLAPQTLAVYGAVSGFEGANEFNIISMVMSTQQDYASLAGAYKNAQKAVLDRQRRAAQRAAQRGR